MRRGALEIVIDSDAGPVRVYCTHLDYLSPAGARTGALLPSDNAADSLEVPGLGRVEVSLVDATNPVVFVRAAELGRTALEAPEALESDPALMQALAFAHDGIAQKDSRDPRIAFRKPEHQI